MNAFQEIYYLFKWCSENQLTDGDDVHLNIDLISPHDSQLEKIVISDRY